MTITPNNIDRHMAEARRKATAQVSQALNADHDKKQTAGRNRIAVKRPAIDVQIGEQGLPDPIPLVSEREPPPEYPLDALNGTLADAARAIAHHVQAPQAMAGQCVLGAASYLAQTRINAPHVLRESGMPASLWLLTLGQSGDRKSECRRLAFKTIEETERKARERFKSEANQYSEMLDFLRGKEKQEFLDSTPKPSDPRTLYSDTTWEKLSGDFIRGMPAAAMDSDEGAQLLGGYSLKSDARSAILGGFTKAFDSGCIERDRSAANLEASGIAYDRRLTVHLLAQPVAVAEALNDPVMRGQGFLARFLFAAPDSLAGTRFLTPERLAENPYNDQAIRRYWNRCEEIQRMCQGIDETGAVMPPTIQIDGKARNACMAFYNEAEIKQEKGGYLEGGLRPFAGRAGELACRVATVLAFFEGHSSITAEVMERACALVGYSLNEWRRYICGSEVDRELADAQRLLEWMQKKNGPIDAEKIRAAHRKTFVPSTNRARELIDILVAHHWLMPVGDGKSFLVRTMPDVPDLPETSVSPGPANARTMPENARSSESIGQIGQASGNDKPSSYALFGQIGHIGYDQKQNPNSAPAPSVGNVGMVPDDNLFSADLDSRPACAQAIDDGLLAGAEQCPDDAELEGNL